MSRSVNPAGLERYSRDGRLADFIDYELILRCGIHRRPEKDRLFCVVIRYSRRWSRGRKSVKFPEQLGHCGVEARGDDLERNSDFALPCLDVGQMEMHLAGHEELYYWTVKATVPTFALTEPDVPVTVIV